MFSDKNSKNKGKIGIRLIVCGLVLFVMAASAVGGVGAVKGQSDDSSANPIQSISFKSDMTIRDALRFLGEKYQKNIVPSAKVDGLVTAGTLYDMTFDKALNAILGHDFKCEDKDNVIWVYTADEYKKIKEDLDRRVYKLFTLYYISAAEAKKLITPLLSENCKLEVTTEALTDFPTGESISTVSGAGDAVAMNDTIIVFDYPENVEQISKILRSVDVKPRQVLVEATVLSVTLTEDMQLGIDWQTLHGTITALSDITRGASDFFKSAGTSQVNKTGGLTVGFAHDNVAGFIRAVEEISDVTILANPKILAVNKQLGQVYIGKKIGYESQTTVAESGTATSKIDFLDTGTKLSFRPYIGNDGYIRMDIHPKDSSGTLKGNNIPDETSAELVTNIIVKDGQTVVVGGLYRDTVTTGRTQIPLLGDLPYVGAAFRGTADQVKREEVIVLLTPHIINEPGETDGQARADDLSRKRISAKDSLQWTGRSRLAEDHYAKAVRCYREGDNESALWALRIALTLRPTYLEALRLRERIIRETDPEAASMMERIILEDMESKDAPKWHRK